MLSEHHGEAVREEPVALPVVRPRLSDPDLQVPSLPPLPESILVLPPEAEDAQEEETPPALRSETTELVELIPSPPAPRGEQPAAVHQSTQAPATPAAVEAPSLQSLSMPSLPRSGREPG
jgi:hypothetical protein